MGDETCSFACISVREADLHGTRSLLPRGHTRREEKARVRGAFWNSIPGRRFHPHGRVRGGFLPPSRSQAQSLFSLVQGTIVMASLVSGRAGDPALDGARRSLMCRFCGLIQSQWRSLVNDARSVPRGCRNRRTNVRRRLFSGRLAINHQAEPLLED